MVIFSVGVLRLLYEELLKKSALALKKTANKYLATLCDEQVHIWNNILSEQMITKHITLNMTMLHQNVRTKYRFPLHIMWLIRKTNYR